MILFLSFISLRLICHPVGWYEGVFIFFTFLLPLSLSLSPPHSSVVLVCKSVLRLFVCSFLVSANSTIWKGSRFLFLIIPPSSSDEVKKLCLSFAPSIHQIQILCFGGVLFNEHTMGLHFSYPLVFLLVDSWVKKSHMVLIEGYYFHVRRDAS